MSRRRPGVRRTVITDKQAEALQKILENQKKYPLDAIRPAEFAKLMWPDSEGWERHARCGPKGVSRGGGMRLAAGGYLGRLCRDDLVRFVGHKYGTSYRVSSKGRKELAAWTAKKATS